MHQLVLKLDNLNKLQALKDSYQNAEFYENSKMQVGYFGSLCLGQGTRPNN